VAVAVAVSAAFFGCRWATNAPMLGARDLGLATTFAVAAAVALYASLGLSLVEALLLVIALLRHSRIRPLLLGLVLALLPIVFVAVVG
jgi:hypothetical protein